tara:strand:+ start:5336 stop:6691 length:1356 start_codon:yes stop_codon:yes gene_type:complete
MTTILLKNNNNNLDYNNIDLINKYYFDIKSDKTINIYNNLDYNIIVSNLYTNNEMYYFTILENYKTTNTNITYNNKTYNYLSGISINEFTTNSNEINISLNIKKNTLNKDKKYTWYLYKLVQSTTNVFDNTLYIDSGSINLLENIIYAEIIYDTNKLISTNPYLLIENKSIMNDNTNIICILKNYTYLIKVIKNTVINYPFNLYENTIIDKTLVNQYNNTLNISIIEAETINLNSQYKWTFDNIIGSLLIQDTTKTYSNNEILYEYKFSNISVQDFLFYKKFIHPEYINILPVFNNNYIIKPEYTSKTLLLNISSNDIIIKLNTTNISVGVYYTIILNSNYNNLSIQFDNDNTNCFKGKIVLNNTDNNYSKCFTSVCGILQNKKIVNTSNTVILKTTNISGLTYNSGTKQYSILNLYCSEYVDNKYVWLLDGNVIGNSIDYDVLYNYNVFV